MPTTNDHNSRHASSSDRVVPDTSPLPPSPFEAKCYYFGLPSQPRLVARSSTNVWVEPTGPEAYLVPKELTPAGLHPLGRIWETVVGPAIVHYLGLRAVDCSSLDPVRIGYTDDDAPPLIIWMGVPPGTLSVKDGIEVAISCKKFLSVQGIDDVHVEIRESDVIRLAKMYKPVDDDDATARAREPFSTALGLPICSAATPTIEGTGGFFICSSEVPDKVFLVTARHVLFNPDDDNEHYAHNNSSQSRKKVLLFGNAAIKKHTAAIERDINNRLQAAGSLESKLKRSKETDGEGAVEKRKDLQYQLDKQRKGIEVLKGFFKDVSRDWAKPGDRVLGHVVLSPPIGLSVGDEKFTEDWAIIEIESSKVDSTNFIGNVIDLGTTIPPDDFQDWMYPLVSNPESFKYPRDGRLHKLCGTVLDEELLTLNRKTAGKPKTADKQNDACIMVMKRGYATGLTVGRLNNLRSYARFYFKDQPGEMSMEIAILPRSSDSGTFSKPGDSGSVVADGKGKLVGLLTGGAGSTEVSDCTYATSINFLLRRFEHYGFKANLNSSFNS